MASMIPMEQAILDVLRDDGPATAHVLAARTGYVYRSLYGTGRGVMRLRQEGLIHVSDWERQAGHGGAPVPVFAYGSGKDKARPAPKKVKEKNAEARVKLRARRSDKSIISILLGTRRAPKGARP